MGWKNIKEHFRISHIVQVMEGKVLIGSAYISEIITIKDDGTCKWTSSIGPGSNGNLARYFKEMSADPAKVRELIEAPDAFAKSITVYTYDGGVILEKKCEEPGWPNITHDGLIQYENTFSVDKAKVIQWAIENARCGVSLTENRIQEIEADLQQRREYLAARRDELAKLLHDYPAEDGPVGIQ